MKIQYVTPVRMPTEKAHGIQIAKACEAFVRAGNQVELIVPTRRTPIKESPFEYYGIDKVFSIRKVWTPDTVGLGTLGFVFHLVWFALAALLHIDRAALIYGRDEYVLAVLIFFGAKRVVWESHDGAWNRSARYVARHARALVVVTEGAKDFYTSNGVSNEKILAVPNGVDLAAFSHPESKEAARTRLGLPQSEKVALYIGRLDGWKGTDTLLAASELLTSGIIAVIGGEPSQIEKLKQQYPKVRFLGSRPYREIADNQAAADVLVVPNTAKDATSVRFTSPLKLLAHLASGRPIVASDLPALRELGKDAVLYVPADEPVALAEGIERLWADPGLAGALVEEAGKRVSGYDWGARAALILAFLAR